MPDVFFSSRAEQLGTLGVRYNVPTIFEFKPFAAAGGLLSYGGSETDNWRLVGNYTGRILKGEKPTALPVQQATKVELHHQPQDREQARDHCAAIGTKPRRRGDRMSSCPLLALSGHP